MIWKLKFGTILIKREMRSFFQLFRWDTFFTRGDNKKKEIEVVILLCKYFYVMIDYYVFNFTLQSGKSSLVILSITSFIIVSFIITLSLNTDDFLFFINIFLVIIGGAAGNNIFFLTRILFIVLLIAILLQIFYLIISNTFSLIMI
jgi:hypothetical protein